MATSKFVPTTKGHLADEIGEIDKEIARLKERREQLAAKLTKQPVKRSIYGHLNWVSIYALFPTTFNHKKAKKLLGEENYNKCWRTSKEPTWCVKSFPIPEAE